MAYFDQEVSLSNMIQHIYGYTSVLRNYNRPHFFAKELKMYIDYLKNDIQSISEEINNAKTKKLEAFKTNLLEGINYYQTLFENIPNFETIKQEIAKQIENYKNEINAIEIQKLQIA